MDTQEPGLSGGPYSTSPNLLEIIRLIDSKIMLLTGAVSMQSVLNEDKVGITKMRGQWHEIDGRWVIPIFHPAYLLRNPSKQPGSPKSLMWQDIQEGGASKIY